MTGIAVSETTDEPYTIKFYYGGGHFFGNESKSLSLTAVPCDKCGSPILHYPAKSKWPRAGESVHVYGGKSGGVECPTPAQIKRLREKKATQKEAHRRFKEGDTSGVPIPEFIWQAKSSFETRYYQSEKALTDYFGTMTPRNYVITKFKKEEAE